MECTGDAEAVARALNTAAAAFAGGGGGGAVPLPTSAAAPEAIAVDPVRIEAMTAPAEVQPGPPAPAPRKPKTVRKPKPASADNGSVVVHGVPRGQLRQMILDDLKKHGLSTKGDIVKRTGAKFPSVHYQMERLLAAGDVTMPVTNQFKLAGGGHG